MTSNVKVGIFLPTVFSWVNQRQLKNLTALITQPTLLIKAVLTSNLIVWQELEVIVQGENRVSSQWRNHTFRVDALKTLMMSQ